MLKENKNENKQIDCSICKYCEIYYDWDDETGDEYPIYICQKGNDTSLDYECADFKEYKTRKPREKETECDKCENLETCIGMGDFIDCTTSYDTRNHYVCSSEGCVKKK